jgi:hypothetical protein
MRFHRWTSMLIALAGVLLSTPPASATAVHAVDGIPTDAIWRIQEFDLHIRTDQRYHSCSSLHQKISGILAAVGAGSVIVKLSCSRDQLTNETFARVVAAAPVEASPENIQAATTFDARQQLTARVRDVRLPTPTDIERFPAEWRKVSLTRVPSLRLGAGDCELLQGMHDQIFPRLSIRVVSKRLTCDSQSLFSPARPTLVVEALVRREA